MANKRVSELAPITANEIAASDLFLVSDVSANESKKLTALGIVDYVLLDSRINTGSFSGTSSYLETNQALITDDVAILSSSILLNPKIVGSPDFIATPFLEIDEDNVTLTGFWNLQSGYFRVGNKNVLTTISTASMASTASYTVSSSFATSASFVQLVYSSSFASYASTASHLLYVPGLSNGTASYGITSVSSSFATTSSYALNSRSPASASWASRSLVATIATSSYTSSHLYYSGYPNGTASYAMAAKVIPTNRIDYGVTSANFQNSVSSSLDSVVFVPVSTNATCTTTVTAHGTAILPITNSTVTNGLVELIALDRWSGVTQSLDSSPIYSLVNCSGSIKVPFSLSGDGEMNGATVLYVTASGITLASNRNVKFHISSISDTLQVYALEPMVFTNNRLFNPLTYISASTPTTYNVGDTATVNGVGLNNIIYLQATSSTFYQFKYVWSMQNLQTFICDDNSYLYDVGGMPASIVSMSCHHCTIAQLPPLSHTNLSWLDCHSNPIEILPSLPATMSYLDCSQTQITTLPTLPYGLTYLKAGICPNLTSVPSTFPNTLLRIDMQNSIALTDWNTPFPTSLTYFYCTDAHITSLPTIPVGVIWLNVSNCRLSSTAITNIYSQLVANGQFNGELYTFDNDPWTPNADYTTLLGRGWTIIA